MTLPIRQLHCSRISSSQQVVKQASDIAASSATGHYCVLGSEPDGMMAKTVIDGIHSITRHYSFGREVYAIHSK